MQSGREQRKLGPYKDVICSSTLHIFSLLLCVSALEGLAPWLGTRALCAQGQKTVWSDQEKPIVAQLQTLRALPDDVRARTMKQLALDIRQLPATEHKVRLANSLANLSTEGDLGTTRCRRSPRPWPTPSASLRRRPATNNPLRLQWPTSNSPSSCATSTCRRRWIPPNSRPPCPSSPRTTNAASKPISPSQTSMAHRGL